MRRLVIDDHAELRPMLDEIDALADRFEKGDEEIGRVLRQRGFEFYQRFAWHLDREERHLAPRLRAQGGREARLAERLDAEHREQRELLQYLLDRLGESTLPTLVIARELRNFAEYVRLDMEHEEADLLDESVLHD